jgi:hypothetical protein
MRDAALGFSLIYLNPDVPRGIELASTKAGEDRR